MDAPPLEKLSSRAWQAIRRDMAARMTARVGQRIRGLVALRRPQSQVTDEAVQVVRMYAK